MTDLLSARDAKRLAIRAQGLADGRPREPITRQHLSDAICRMGLLQIDSVNVCVRSHYMPLFSRLGHYEPGWLDELAYVDKSIFETWAHEASFVPAEHRRFFQPRMAAHTANRRATDLMRDDPEYIEAVLQQVRERGAMSASELDGAGERCGPWWGYAAGKVAMEWHFASGTLSVAKRKNFTRYYDLTERVIAPEYLPDEPPSTQDAHRELMRIAVRAHGVGTVADLADYYRINKADARARLAELCEEGAAHEVRVQGWAEDAYIAGDPASMPPARARALLTPFDPLVWNRARIQRLFDFFYRIEIYVPEKKRRFGYYVYPFVLGDDLVARVDLKAERDKGVLRVKGAYCEDGHDRDEVAEQLAGELRLMAGWLALKRVGTGRRGDLMPALRAALKR